MANWIAAHNGWLGAVGSTAILAACLAVVACVWRALRFTQPIFRGASFLGLDLETRRRELDGLIANQTRHVDAIAAEVDAHARRTEEAERRASAADEGAARPAAPLVDSPFEPTQDEGDQRARLAAAFTASLDAAIGRGAENYFSVPQRILVALDDLDSWRRRVPRASSKPPTICCRRRASWFSSPPIRAGSPPPGAKRIARNI